MYKGLAGRQHSFHLSSVRARPSFWQRILPIKPCRPQPRSRHRAGDGKVRTDADEDDDPSQTGSSQAGSDAPQNVDSSSTSGYRKGDEAASGVDASPNAHAVSLLEPACVRLGSPMCALHACIHASSASAWRAKAYAMHACMSQQATVSPCEHGQVGVKAKLWPCIPYCRLQPGQGRRQLRP